MIILVMTISIVIFAAVCIKKIHTYRQLKKMLGEHIKKSIRPENTFTFDEFDELLEKYGGDEN